MLWSELWIFIFFKENINLYLHSHGLMKLWNPSSTTPKMEIYENVKINQMRGMLERCVTELPFCVWLIITLKVHEIAIAYWIFLKLSLIISLIFLLPLRPTQYHGGLLLHEVAWSFVSIYMVGNVESDLWSKCLHSAI